MKRRLYVLACMLVCSMLITSAVVVAPKPPKPPPGGEDLGTEYRITNYPGDESIPRINGNILVWIAPSSPYNIYMYYLGPDGIPFTNDLNEGEYIVSDHANGEDWPDVYGNKIVWRQKVGDTDRRELFMYHLGNDFIPGSGDAPEEGLYQLTTDSQGEWGVAKNDIYENVIVYQAENIGIVVLDLGANGIPDETDSRIVIPDTIDEAPPSIYGNKVIFEKNDDIYIYYLSGPRQGQIDIHDTPYRVSYWYGEPAIYENLIVWSDDRNSKNPNRPDVPQWINWDIYMYDLGEDGLYGTADDGGETLIVGGNSDDFHPTIHGTKVAFVTGSKMKIGFHDLATGKTEDLPTVQDAWYPDIFGNNIVYQNNPYGNGDIYLFVLNE